MEKLFLQTSNVFQAAKPIWPIELMGQMNYTVEFRAVIDCKNTGTGILKITTSTVYRVFINGEFAGYGPARAAEGYFRVDEIDLSDKLKQGINIVAIEVAVYNVENFYIMKQPEFIQAELLCQNVVVASTHGVGALFEARLCKDRVQKISFNSFLRGSFIEYYRLNSNNADWRTKLGCNFQPIECEILEEKKLLPRKIDYPEFKIKIPVSEIEKGVLQEDITADTSWRECFAVLVGEKKEGYTDKEVEVNPVIEIQQQKCSRTMDGNGFLTGEYKNIFTKGTYTILDFGTNLTGFIGSTVVAKDKTRIFFVFDEKLTDGDVDYKRSNINPYVIYELEKGSYQLEAFEPYTLRYLKIMVLEGECELNHTYLREYVNPDVDKAYFSSSDRRLSTLFEAGRETLRQNSVDVFTDCPSRERGGYLCDSFFTARAAFDLSGNTKVERIFFENYLLFNKADRLPENMLPMCYPSDVVPKLTNADTIFGHYIPNWSLWLVVQLEEYLIRSGDLELVEQFKTKILNLFKYFKGFENEFGLLEKLDGWVFIEWSKANDYVQDVNFPSNMLYSGALAAAGRMYKNVELLERSNQLKEQINKMSFDGTFFVDNAVRENGELKVTKNITEVCQYYAFFFQVATIQTHPSLWHTLRTEFGPSRKKTGAYSEVDPANAFIGNYLRLDLLSQNGLGQQLVEESRDYLMYMVNQTGTIWEHADDSASCNHGFGSHIVHWLYTNVLGVRSIDVMNKTITLRFEESQLEWCEGRIPFSRGYVNVRWWKENNVVYYNVELPDGFRLVTENLTGLRLVRS